MMTKDAKNSTKKTVNPVPDLSQYDFPEDYTPFSDDNLDMLP